MQRIFHDYRNKSYLFTMIENLFTCLSDVNHEDDSIVLDPAFAPLCDMLSSFILSFDTPAYKEINMPMLTAKKNDPKEITICLSGGKDSVALALYYKKQGYKVHLYHAQGINRAYGDERKAAMAIADYIGCDLFVDKFYIDGPNSFIEHPLKNYIIANGAIHYCLEMGYSPRIAFGTFNQASVNENEFEVCGGDCIEMWDIYRELVRKVLPEFDIDIPLETNADTFTILSDDEKLFALAVSCMSPYRFREYWKHRSEEKYGVRLFDNRCGCCWKCCLEWMWLADHDKVPYNEEFYLHCYDILDKTIYKETGVHPERPNDLWDNYMFYPFAQSKAYSKLMKKGMKIDPKRRRKKKKKKKVVPDEQEPV